MKTVFKYPIDIDDEIEVAMPAGAQVLTVQTQYDKPCVWALVETTAPIVTRRFHMSGTGHEIHDSDASVLSYVGTFQMRGGALVFHLFAYPEVKP